MTISFQPKLFLASFLLLCLLFILSPSRLFAGEIGILVRPAVIDIHPQENGVIKKQITIENSGKDPVDVVVVIKPFRAKKDGSLYFPPRSEIAEDVQNFITANVKVLENDIPISELILAPGQKENLDLNITIENVQNISNYTFSLLFLSASSKTQVKPIPEENEPVQGFLGVTIGSGIHVLISGKQAGVDPDINITRFETEKLLRSGPVSFLAEIQNTGSKYSDIYGYITIINMFGQQVGVIRIPHQIILAGAKKTIGSGSSEHAVLVWEDRFLLGSYKAEITVVSDTGQQSIARTSFFAFPVRKTLLVLVAFLLVSFIISQVRQRIS
ncbi:MAG: hypothetical protein HYV40_01740 [Candidatus Levybacteria bacterium]|nr:hypothetical protein [Candidatus Levybacteria bacterium]